MFEKNGLTFKELRKYLSRIDRLSICNKETLQYKNYIYLEEVPTDYDDMYVYGVGMINSEFFQVGESQYKAEGNIEDIVLLPCIEIMLSEAPKTDF